MDQAGMLGWLFSPLLFSIDVSGRLGVGSRLAQSWGISWGTYHANLLVVRKARLMGLKITNWDVNTIFTTRWEGGGRGGLRSSTLNWLPPSPGLVIQLGFRSFQIRIQYTALDNGNTYLISLTDNAKSVENTGLSGNTLTVWTASKILVWNVKLNNISCHL